VLDLSKLENKKMRLVEQPVNLHRLCEEVHTLLAPTIKKGVQFILDVDPLNWVLADPLRWRQLLVNLLSNAFKFTTEGSICVKIKVLSSEVPDRIVSDRAVSDMMLGVWISDTGCGVSPESAATLFSIFESQSNAFAQKGSGVGLVLSQHIVQLMGGEIRVESPYHPVSATGSEAVGGTCLDFTIPIAICKKPTEVETRPTKTFGPSRALPASLVVLIVEDEPMNQVIINM
jgi:signal transduction histidine kinase